MSRLGGAGAVAPLVTDIPISTVEVLDIIKYITAKAVPALRCY